MQPTLANSKTPQIYTQGQNITDHAGRTGVVNFNTQTGAPLATGATTPINPVMQPVNPVVPPSTPGFNIDTSVIPSTVLGSNQTPNSVMNYRNQLQAAYDQNQAQINPLQQQLVNLAQPGAQEQQAAQELTALNQAERQGLLNTENKVIPMEFITGQQAAISKQAAIKRLAASEGLQALTGQRLGQLDAIKAALGFADSNFEKLLGIQSEFRKIDAEDRQTARETLNSIMEYSKGKAFDELDPQSQQEVIGAVANSPLSLGMVQHALDNNKIAFEEDQQKTALGLQAQQANIAQSKSALLTDQAQRANIYDQIATRREQLAMDKAAALTPGAGKPPTDAQVTSSGYASRVELANKTLQKLEPTLKKMSYAEFAAVQSGNPLLNKVLTAEQQQAAQAMRNFINAQLRRESGAAISPTEFTSAQKQYFPQYGDKQENLNQKKANRQIVERALIKGAGPAYTPLTAEELSLSGLQSETTQMTGPDGNQYNVPNDQVAAFKAAGGK